MDTPFVKRAYNLGLKAVPNFTALSEEQIAYYEKHLDELPVAIERGFVLPEKKFALENLKLIAESVPVSTDSFVKDSFFKNGPVKFWFGDNFKSWILSAMPEAIPGFTSSLTQTQLTKYMSDSEILDELGDPEPLTVSEFAAIVKSMAEKQPNGESGSLLTNGCANIFFVKLNDGRVVAVFVDRGSVDWYWFLNAVRLDDGRWHDGDCVFSRSPDVSRGRLTS